MKSRRFFFHKHIRSTTSWALPEMVALAVTSGVGSSVCDTCTYGMVGADEFVLAPAEKRTMLLAT